MSLVERALKKLQESRSSTSLEPETAAAKLVIPGNSARRSASDTLDLGNRVSERISLDDSEEGVKLEAVSRRIVIDRDALRAMELLAPVNLERQIASQYQQVKRPLIASALNQAGIANPYAHAIMLASALPGEGKTFTSINLALSLALEKDTEVLLVDADVAKPHLTKIFGLQSEPGLLDLLANSSMRPQSAIVATDVPGLSILPSGKQTETATELLASDRMREVVKQLAKANGRRIVLFDSPPLLLSMESRALIPSVGQIVLVIRAEVTAQRAVQDAIDIIGEDKAVSLILNQTSIPASGGYYGYGTYGDTPSETSDKT